jgi:hypothetical protein
MKLQILYSTFRQVNLTPAVDSRSAKLAETGLGRRRLFRKGDTYHPAREGGKITPIPEQIPPEYSELLNWYQEWSSDKAKSARAADPLLELKGSGAHLWSDETPDKYVRRLREGWE